MFTLYATMLVVAHWQFTAATASKDIGVNKRSPDEYEVEGCFSSFANSGSPTPMEDRSSNLCCQRMCRAKGFILAATQGNQCYCGNIYPKGNKTKKSECSTRCRSYTACYSPQSCCGGPNAYSVSVVGNIDVAKQILRRLAHKWQTESGYRDHVKSFAIVSGPPSHEADWGAAMDRRGWSTCGKGRYMTGMFRHDYRSGDERIGRIEKAECVEAPNYLFPSVYNQTCYDEDVSSSFNRKGWSTCKNGYYMNALYRSNGNKLDSIETFKCCRQKSQKNQWGECYTHDASKSFNNKGWTKCRSGHYLAGLNRNDCNELYCLEEFKCCKMGEYDSQSYVFASESKTPGHRADWTASMKRRGWSTCGKGRYMTGMWRSDYDDSYENIYKIQKAECFDAPKYLFSSANDHTCYDEDVSSSFNRKGWSKCRIGYYMNGLFISNQYDLDDIKKFKCCRPKSQKIQWGKCYTHNAQVSFDRRGWTKCRSGHYLAGLFRNDCNRLHCLEEFKCCKMGEYNSQSSVSESESISQSHEADWEASMSLPGWSTCGKGRYMTGIWTPRFEMFYKYIDDIRKAECFDAPKYLFASANDHTCYDEDVSSSFNHEGWSTCKIGYYMNALYRSYGNKLDSIETFKCCRPISQEEQWGKCYTHDPRSSIDKGSEGWTKCRSGYYLAGLSRYSCDELTCLREIKCCKMGNNSGQSFIERPDFTINVKDTADEYKQCTMNAMDKSPTSKTFKCKALSNRKNMLKLNAVSFSIEDKTPLNVGKPKQVDNFSPVICGAKTRTYNCKKSLTATISTSSSFSIGSGFETSVSVGASVEFEVGAFGTTATTAFETEISSSSSFSVERSTEKTTETSDNTEVSIDVPQNTEIKINLLSTKEDIKYKWKAVFKLLGKYFIKWENGFETFEDVTTVLSGPDREMYAFGTWKYPGTNVIRVVVTDLYGKEKGSGCEHMSGDGKNCTINVN